MDFKNKFEQRKIENAMLHRAYDEKMYAFFKELDQKRKNNKFQSWLDTYIDYTNYMYDDELDDNTEIIQIRSIIASFVSNLWAAASAADPFTPVFSEQWRSVWMSRPWLVGWGLGAGDGWMGTGLEALAG